MEHDSVYVYYVQKQLSKQNFPLINKVVYFTDGAASHFKNRKSFLNLAYHKEDFGLSSEWHFHATSHGKSGVNGVAGTFKITYRQTMVRNENGVVHNATELLEKAKCYSTIVQPMLVT